MVCCGPGSTSAALGKAQPLLEFDTDLLLLWIFTDTCIIALPYTPIPRHAQRNGVWSTTDYMHLYDITSV